MVHGSSEVGWKTDGQPEIPTSKESPHAHLVTLLTDSGVGHKEKLSVWKQILNFLGIQKWIRIAPAKGLETTPTVYVRVNALAKVLGLSTKELRKIPKDERIAKIATLLTAGVKLAYGKGFDALLALVNSGQEKKVYSQLLSLQNSGAPDLQAYAKRVIGAFDTLKKIGPDALTKETAKTRGDVTLSEQAMLKIALVAEAKIALAGAGAEEGCYIKRTDAGLERSLVIDLKTKSWTVVVGDLVGTGGYKKVKTGQLIAPIHEVGKELAVDTRQLIVAVNRKGLQLNEKEVAIAKQFSDDPRGIAGVRVFASFSAGGEKRQVIVQEKAKHDLFFYAENPKIVVTNEQMKAWASDACYGLHRMHAKNLVHRDLKPENLLLFEDGVKLCDFGLTAEPQQNEYYGTSIYSAPEYFENKKEGFVADVYALGAALYTVRFKSQPRWMVHIDTHVDAKSPAESAKALQWIRYEQDAVRAWVQDLEQQATTRALTPDESINLNIYRMLHPDATLRPDATACMQLWA